MVVSAHGRALTDLGVTRGRIVAPGDLQVVGTVVDASGLLVFPGMVDTHVHLMDPGSTEREDFPHGTGAPAAGASPPSSAHPRKPCALTDELMEKVGHLRGRSDVDSGWRRI